MVMKSSYGKVIGKNSLPALGKSKKKQAKSNSKMSYKKGSYCGGKGPSGKVLYS